MTTDFLDILRGGLTPTYDRGMERLTLRLLPHADGTLHARYSFQTYLDCYGRLPDSPGTSWRRGCGAPNRSWYGSGSPERRNWPRSPSTSRSPPGGQPVTAWRWNCPAVPPNSATGSR